MKKAIVVALVVILVPVLALVGALVGAFAGSRPLVDATELPGGARLVKDGIVSAYVLPAGDGVALIDCGNDVKGGAILAELARRHLTAEAVKAVFLTHAHGDHTAGCHLFPKAEVMAFEGDVGLAAGTSHSKGLIPTLMGNLAVERRVGVTRTLKDGEEVAVGPLTVRAYATPGHTSGSAGYLANGVLYLGDSANGASDGTLKAAPWIFSDDTAQNRASLKALAARLKADGVTVQMMAFAHSGPLDGMGALEAFRGE